MPHRGVANMALGMGRVLGVGPDDSLLQFAPLNFDASALQLFVPLMAGGRSVLVPAPGRLGARDFMDLADRHGLTMLDLPAALWRQWVETMTEEGLRMAPSIRIFLTGGEALSPRTMRRWAALCDRKVAFLSSYGPTEASITATATVSDSTAMAAIGDGVPDIGMPLPNVAVHVLDLFGRPAAPGVIGEIAIGGPGVATGYLGDPDRTAAVFVERPGLGRVYLTGDYGRRTAEGRYEFHGRRDAQIKIRGFRIEPAEVEGAMLAHPAVAAALVTTQKTEDRRARLVAYAVPKGVLAAEAAEAWLADLRAHLQARLPEAMVPQAIQVLPAFPLLPNGKIDRRALPPVTVAEAEDRPYEPPLPGPETVLAEIWQAMLKVETVGRSDNFFERGGDSILSLQLAARARRAGLAFEVRDVFRHQTLAALAAAARVTTADAEGARDGCAALPAATAALLARADLIAERLDLTVSDAVTADALRAGVAALLARHEGLCARFADGDGPALVIPAAPDGDVFVAVDATDAPRVIAEAARAVIAGAPHLRAVFGPGPRLTLLAHPALVDGESWRILAEDLASAVAGATLPAAGASVLAAVARTDLAERVVAAAPVRRQRRFALSTDAAVALAGPALAAFRLAPREIVLAALVRCLAADRQMPEAIAVDVLRRPRGQLDLSRTVWGLSSLETVAFAPLADDRRAGLIAVMDRLRAPSEADAAAPTGALLYADLPAADLPDGWTLRPAAAAPLSAHPLVVRFDGAAGALVVDHAEAVWTSAAVEALAAALAAEIDALVALCLTPGVGALTRSDVPLATVTQGDLDRLAAAVPAVETVADASFGQAGMLFHSLLDPEAAPSCSRPASTSRAPSTSRC